LTTTLLIDADIVAFKIASISQKTHKFQDDETGEVIECVDVDDWEDVTPRVDELLAEYLQKTKADELIICLSCPTDEGWRIGIYPQYKANRDYSKRPVYLSAVKDYMAEKYRSYRKPTMEADDIMGILSTHPTLVPGRKIIVSEDKDLQTIPGWLWNPAKDPKPRLIDEHHANYFHFYQTLVGDTTDNYKGCPGIGDKKATALLEKHCHETKHDSEFDDYMAWEDIVALFVKKGLSAEDALLQARVARICRADDYNFKKQEVILWNP
jgi:DNA polymerase-1